MTHFYPEMDQTAPASALIIGRITAGRGASVYYVKWSDANDAKVRELLAKHKISAKNVDRFESVLTGEKKWSAHMTMKAYAKAQAGIAATECLLD